MKAGFKRPGRGEGGIAVSSAKCCDYKNEEDQIESVTPSRVRSSGGVPATLGPFSMTVPAAKSAGCTTPLQYLQNIDNGYIA